MKILRLKKNNMETSSLYFGESSFPEEDGRLGGRESFLDPYQSENVFGNL